MQHQWDILDLFSCWYDVKMLTIKPQPRLYLLLLSLLLVSPLPTILLPTVVLLLPNNRNSTTAVVGDVWRSPRIQRQDPLSVACHKPCCKESWGALLSWLTLTLQCTGVEDFRKESVRHKYTGIYWGVKTKQCDRRGREIRSQTRVYSPVYLE